MEKRKRKRIPLQMVVTFITDDSEYSYENLKDVSMSGLFVITNHILPMGTKGSLTISYSSENNDIRVITEAEVARLVNDPNPHNNGMGLKFIEIDTDSSINLFNILKYQAK